MQSKEDSKDRAKMQSNAEGLQKIKQRIMADAEKDVKKIIDRAKKEVSRINEANKKEAESYKKTGEEKLKSDVKLFINKTMAQARLKSRRAYLERREQLMYNLIDDVLGKFDRKLKGYSRYVERIIADNLIYLTGTVTIFCNKRDFSLVNPFVDKVKENPDNSHIDKVEIKENPIKAGLILEDSEGKRINESVDSKFERTKQKIRQGIIKVLG